MPRPQVGIEQISLFPLESLTSSKKSLVMDALLFGPKKEAERLARNLKEFHFLSRSTDPKTSKVAAEKAVTFKHAHRANLRNPKAKRKNELSGNSAKGGDATGPGVEAEKRDGRWWLD